MSGIMFGNFKILNSDRSAVFKGRRCVGGVGFHLVSMHHGEDAVDFSNADLNDSLVVSCLVIGHIRFLSGCTAGWVQSATMRRIPWPPKLHAVATQLV